MGSGEDSDDSMDEDTNEVTNKKKETAVVSKPTEHHTTSSAAVAQIPAQAALANPPAPVVSVHVETETAKEEGKVVVAESKSEVALPAALVDMTLYDSAAALEAVGLEVLKAELTRLGMKCGGTLKDRAERLFLTKHTKVEDLPAQVLVKGRK